MAHPSSNPPSARAQMREVLAELRKSQNLPALPPKDDWEDEDTIVTFRRNSMSTEFRAKIPRNVKVVGVILAIFSAIGAIIGALKTAGVF